MHRMLKGEYMAEELEKWRYPRFFSDTIDENDRIIYMNDEDSKHIAQVLRMRKGDKAIICDKNRNSGPMMLHYLIMEITDWFISL